MRKGYYMEMWHMILEDRGGRGEAVITDEIRLLKKDKELGLIFRSRKDRIAVCKFLRTMRKYVIYREMMLHDIWMEIGKSRYDVIRSTCKNVYKREEAMCGAERGFYYYNLYMDEIVRKIETRYADHE